MKIRCRDTENKNHFINIENSNECHIHNADIFARLLALIFHRYVNADVTEIYFYVWQMLCSTTPFDP